MEVAMLRIFRNAKELPKVLKRNFGLTVPVLQSDPIQQLFIEKLREYRKLNEDGKLTDISPEMEKELKNDLTRIEKQYGVSGIDATKFPTFNFPDPKYDPINLSGK